MKTNYRRKRTKARYDHGPGYYGRTKDFKRDTNNLIRRDRLPGVDDEDEERPRKAISWWSYD